MTRLFKIAFVFLVVFFCTCKKIRQLKEFDLNYSEEFVIPANSVVNLPFNLNSQETTTNTSDQYENEGTSRKLVETVVLSRLVFTVQSPASSNFDFLKNVEIYLSSPNNAEVLVAYRYDIPETGLKQLEMETSETNLKDFLQDESYQVRVKAVTDHPVTQDVTIKCDETFHVTARLRNVFK